MQKIKLAIAGVLVAVASWMIGGSTAPKLGGFSNLASYPCTVSSSVSKVVGNQASTQILATSSRRVWAIIESPSGATNTVSLMAKQDVKATAGVGVLINATTSNASYPVRQEMTFGLNTDMPYMGAVQGISQYGSTTVSVVECVY